jgi:hypothetical protein
MPDTTLTPKSVRITADETKWLSAAASKGAVTQNDLIRLALHRLRKEHRGGQQDQTRDHRGDREDLQVQAHPTPSDRQQAGLARKDAITLF